MRIVGFGRRSCNVFVVLGLLLINIVALSFTIEPSFGTDEWWDTNWTYRMKILFNNTAISENLVNFPMPLVFSSSHSDFWSNVKSDGADIRFIDADGFVELYFELENWNYTSNNMVAWVRIPQVDANSNADYVWIYYGNMAANFDSYHDHEQVWDANCKIVLHFNETSGASTYDSTSNNQDATLYGGTLPNATGKINSGILYDGVIGCYIKGVSNISSHSSYTLEGWFRPASGVMGRYSDIWAFSGGEQFPNQLGGESGTSNKFGVWRSSGSIWSTSTYSVNVWHYGAITCDGSTTRVYFNGINEANGTVNTISGSWYIGDKSPGSTSERYQGVIDECRLSSTARSANWIKACYQYQLNQSKFAYGVEETCRPAKFFTNPPLVEKTIDDVGHTFEVNVTIEDIKDLFGFDFNLTWDSSLITLVNVDFDATLDNIWGHGNWFLACNQTGGGYYELAAVSTSAGFTSTEATALVALEFCVEYAPAGETLLHFVMAKLGNSRGKSIRVEVTDGVYRLSMPEAKLYVDPPSVEKTPSDVGTTFKVNITTIDVIDLFGFDLNLTWKNDLITLVGAEYQTTLDAVWGADNWVNIKNETGPGWYKLVAVSISSGCNISNAKALATLTFRVESSQNWDAETTLHFAVKKLSNSQAQLIQLDDYDGTYSIRGISPTLKIQADGDVFRIYGEACHVSIVVSDAANVKDCTFEIYFNTSMLDYVTGSEVWGALGTGVLMANETEGKLQGTIGPAASINGSQWLVNFTFNEVYHHVWKDESQVPTWRNNQTGRIWFHWANLSYTDHPDLSYTEGGLNQINTTEVNFTFSPIKGDVDNNGTVDVFDLRIIGYHYDIDISDPEWPAASQYDLNGDDIIEIQDLVIAESNFGYVYNG